MVSPASFPVPDQTGRTIVVTGANSGLGFETAKRLAAAGAHVVLACRNVEKARDAAARMTGSTAVLQLDTASLASVRAFAEAAPDRVDVLVNNAGVMAVDEGRTDEGFELQLGTNYLGAFALTALLLPRLTDRVVMLSSLAHFGGRIVLDDLNHRRRRYNRWGAYGQSKLADLMFAQDLQSRFAEARSPLRAMAAHPGLASTSLGKDISMPKPLSAVTEAILKAGGQSAAQGALPTLYAATTADLPGGSYIGPGGLAGLRGAPVVATTSPASRDRRVQRLLTKEAERLTGARIVVPA